MYVVNKATIRMKMLLMLSMILLSFVLLGTMMTSGRSSSTSNGFFLFAQACDLAIAAAAASPHRSSNSNENVLGVHALHDHDSDGGQRLLQEEEEDEVVEDNVGMATTNGTTAQTEVSSDGDNNSNNCTIDPSSPVTGLTVDLRMISRQTRGVLTLESNCRIRVQRLEVFVGDSHDNNSNKTITLDWYGALSLDPSHVANATLLHNDGVTLQSSSQLLHDNATTSSEVVLSFDTTYDLTSVGAILLVERRNSNDDDDNESNATQTTASVDDDNVDDSLSFTVLGQALIQKLVPGPAKDLLEAQPTMFDNCWTLSDTARIRWTIVEIDNVDGESSNNNTNKTSSYIEIGMEYIVPFVEDDTWMAFGPAATGVQDRLMGGSDVVIAGFRSTSSVVDNDEDDDDVVVLPFADDYYIGGYEVCTKLQPDREKDYDGVCRDSVWRNSDGDDDNDVELLYWHTIEGVAFLRYRRPLSATTQGLDHAVVPGSLQNYVWARGPLDPSAGIAEVQFHGYQFGELKGVDMNETTWVCPPLKGIRLDGNNENGDFPEDDSFEFRTMLEGNVVEVFWTLLPETSQIRIGARANVRGSSWMSIAIGDSMTDAWAWVATASTDGEQDEGPQLLGYRMNGLDATTVVLLPDDDENGLFAGPSGVTLTDSGVMSFEVVAQWPLPGMNNGDTAAPLIWAVGPSWRTDAETPRRKDEHSVRSKVSTRIDFATGAASAGKETSNAMLLAHGALMWIAWLVVAPLTGIASRFVRDDSIVPEWVPLWVTLHKRLATLVLILSLTGLVLAVVAVSDTGLRHILSSHAKLGVAVIAMVVVQNILGTQRPSPDPSPGWHKRRLWEYQHRIFAFVMLALAIASTITGSVRLENFDSATRYGVRLTVAWIAVIALLLGAYEVRRRQVRNVSEEPVEEKVEDEEEQNGGVSKPIKALKLSPWIGSWNLVYVIPGAIGIFALVVLTVVTFTEPSEQGSSVMEDMNVSEAAASDWYNPSTADAPDGCWAKPQSYVGDGWCDDHTPYNTESCGWDGGDCCDITAQLYNCKDPDSEHFGKSSTKGWPVPMPVPRNPRYTVDREETLASWVVSYNNYYEFGLSKDVVEEANKHADFLAPEDWFVDISGLVENPMTLDVKALISQMHLEERLYRHRCVEAWSITSEWIGFPLVKLLDMVRPLGNAEIVRFTSWKDFKHSKVQETTNYPWPYTEALTMGEARNELALVTVGAFGKPLEPQSGAPIRLNIPWKYGFKSIKSFQKIEFLADEGDSRRTFWSTQNGREYGFYANVNPDVDHARWSQATERHFVTGHPGMRLPSTRMNGYQKQVDYMYNDLEDRAIYF